MSVLNLVRNNPYRVLGVYVNSPVKDRVTNKNRLAAFARVGKPCVFPKDMTELFANPSRSVDDIARAEQQINLDQDKLKYAFFWFIQASPLDTAALSNVQSGNKEKTLEILKKRDSFSSLINRALLAYAENDLNTAVKLTTLVIHTDEYRDGFIKAICGENFELDEESVAKLYIDALAQEVGWEDTYKLFRSEGYSADDDEYIVSKLIKEPIADITGAIEELEDAGEASYEIGDSCRNLIQKTRHNLSVLNNVLDSDDSRLMLIRDKLAIAIKSLSARYFNSIESPNEAVFEQVEEWLNLAYDLALGSHAIEQIEKEREEFNQARQGAKIMDVAGPLILLTAEFKESNKSLSQTETFVDKAKQEVDRIKLSVGDRDELLVTVSSNIASMALSAVISIVNDAQSSKLRIQEGLKSGSINRIFSQAVRIVRKIDTLIMNYETQKRVTENKRIIESTFNKITEIQNRQSSSSSSGGFGSLVFWGVIIFIAFLMLK